MSGGVADPGSFRDPGGRVFKIDGRIFRAVYAPAADDFDYVESTGLVARLVDKGWMVGADKVDPDLLGEAAAGTHCVLEHPCLPFISYPYEWSFPALKAAALRHLDIQLEALNHGIALSDASAYNIQFQGANPLFIDRLSLVRYREGEIWAAHRQFCEQFLNPLLLRACLGVTHNAWYRGRQEGIATDDLRRMLKWRHKLSWKVFTHVVLQSALQRGGQGNSSTGGGADINKAKLPRAAFQGMLEGLRNWIAGLEPADTGKTVWRDYAGDNSYSSNEAHAKREFVADYAADVKPDLLWDLGCNTGDFSVAAIENGAGYAVGFDSDQGALELGFARAAEEKMPLQTLYLDATNPSPDQGWAQAERAGLSGRATADGVLALAFVHHLAIAGNVPLDRLVDWLIGLAPTGVIEFVPKADPMVQVMLAGRQDVFDKYDADAFESAVAARARIGARETVTDSGRLLIAYDRG